MEKQSDLTSSKVFALPFHHQHELSLVASQLCPQDRGRELESQLKLRVFRSFFMPLTACMGRPSRGTNLCEASSFCRRMHQIGSPSSPSRRLRCRLRSLVVLWIKSESQAPEHIYINDRLKTNTSQRPWVHGVQLRPWLGEIIRPCINP